MATVVLTAVGAVVGGPIGAAIGAIAGQQIDQALFAPKARHGPRLGELSVQTSSYGTQIPKIFGTMRVAGTVIWATDLKEQKGRSGGGKGRPKTVTYSYSASFAVALSGRPIRGVRRIWADGKLLRGAAGDFKSETGFRLHLGSEDQAVDPTIATIEGVGQVTAHRGLAYAVFEDFQLADYGNRIPSLTFEVEADEEAVEIGVIAEALSLGAVRGGETPLLDGYAASGDSLRGVLEGLAAATQLSLREEDDHLLLTRPAGTERVVLRSERGARGGSRAAGRTETFRKAASAVPSEVSIAHHDPERDYQTSLQRAVRGAGSAGSERLAFPAVLTAGAAKGLAEARLEQLWAARESAKLHLGIRGSGIAPGTVVRLEGEQGRWKVARSTLGELVASLELVRLPSLAGATDMGGTPGRSLPQPDEPHGPTTLFLFDLPSPGEELSTRPHLLAFAAGAEGGWRKAALLASYDGGNSWEAEGATAAAAVIGRAVTAAGPAGAALFDDRTAIEVELLNEGMWLEGRSDQALASGANLAVIGRELVQFGRAEPLGGGRFRLSRLLRGRRGTEWAAGMHAAGEPFALIESETAAVIEPPAGLIGAEVRVIPQGLGDGDGAPFVQILLEGQSLQPPSPVHLVADRGAGGDLEIRWVRRSRLGWLWSGGGDAPLAEESESYRLTIVGATSRREIAVHEPRFTYSAEQQAADGAQGPLRIEVVQIGTHAASQAAILVLDQ